MADIVRHYAKTLIFLPASVFPARNVLCAHCFKRGAFSAQVGIIFINIPVELSHDFLPDTIDFFDGVVRV
ncbi:MAG: hypothetical protein LBB74_08610 [Chitinispirillales bacterium]|nr:hypothetical protein [Chitinispirillales bacterium]